MDSWELGCQAKGMHHVSNERTGTFHEAMAQDVVLNTMFASQACISCASSSPPASFSEHLASLLATFLQQHASPIPPHFRATLLADDNCEAFHTSISSPHLISQAHRLCFQEPSASLVEGVPVYPLYKHLACALHEWMVTAVFPRRIESIPGCWEDDALKTKVGEWSPKVIELLTRLKELMLHIKFQLRAEEPFFSLLRDGSRTVEATCAVDPCNGLSHGDLILFNNTLLQSVKATNHYRSFEEMLRVESLDKVLPGVKSVVEGAMVYRRLYTEEKEMIGGIIAIHMQCLPEDQQPLKIVGSVLEMKQRTG